MYNEIIVFIINVIMQSFPKGSVAVSILNVLIVRSTAMVMNGDRVTRTSRGIPVRIMPAE
jgi:hypothetical protein